MQRGGLPAAYRSSYVRKAYPEGRDCLREDFSPSVDLTGETERFEDERIESPRNGSVKLPSKADDAPTDQKKADAPEQQQEGVPQVWSQSLEQPQYETIKLDPEIKPQLPTAKYDLYGRIEPYEKETDEGAQKGIGRSFWHDGDEALAMIWIRQVRSRQAGRTPAKSLSPERIPPFSQPPHLQGKEEEAIVWLKTFLKTAEANQFSEQDCLDLTFRVLSGRAFSWLCQEVTLITRTRNVLAMEAWERWSLILLRFAKCFVIRSGYNMRNQLKMRTQRRKEDVRAYYNALVALAERIRPPIPEDDFKEEFMLGLRDPATKQVAKMASAMNKALEEVVDHSTEFNSREKRRSLREVLMTMKQRQKETLKEYADSFKAVAGKMKPQMHDADLIDFFADGLRDGFIHDQVQRHLPKTLPEAIEIAFLQSGRRT